MEKGIVKKQGIALISGSLLMILTMTLHPVGGTIEHLQNIYFAIIVSHSLAIVSIPFSFFGFLGLTKRLSECYTLSSIAFITMTLALFSVMCAAAINGLALPLFLQGFNGATPEVVESIKPIFKYNTALNNAFDFIYIGATLGSILLWSVAILKTKKIRVWIGYLGILLCAVTVILLHSGFVFLSLLGFRIFIVGVMSWIVLIGSFLMKQDSGYSA